MLDNADDTPICFNNNFFHKRFSQPFLFVWSVFSFSHGVPQMIFRFRPACFAGFAPAAAVVDTQVTGGRCARLGT